MMPQRLDYISSYISKLFTSKSSNSLPPPLMIKGDYGTGKSWVLIKIFRELERVKDVTFIYPIYLHYQLSPKGIISSITSRINQIESHGLLKRKLRAENERPNRYVVLWDRFDHTYQMGKPDRTSLPTRAFGAGSPILQKIQYASELRSFLIENTNRITFIGTVHSIEFMTNEELPFFKFFNVIDIEPLNHKESRDYIYTLIVTHPKAIELLNIIEGSKLFDGIDCCEGKISILNLFSDTLLEDRAHEVNSVGELINQFYLSFFAKLDPYVMMLINDLSDSEKLFLNLLLNDYKNNKRPNLAAHPEINITKVTKSLIEKNILELRSSPARGFIVRSLAVINWFQFYKSQHFQRF